MQLALLSEDNPQEQRVALTPGNVKVLVKLGLKVSVQQGAGEVAGFKDVDYEEAGATLATNRRLMLEKANIVVQVQPLGCLPSQHQDVSHLKPGQLVIGCMDPLSQPEVAGIYADKKVSAMALEMIPRISRAQSMDVLSSMATIAGYKAVLLAASASPRMMPMLMTAAGTLSASRVFIMGAGVAGLQAAAAAKRMGAIVEAYDVRPAAREQILSVGATPVELDLDTEESEGKGGYASAQSADFIARQQSLMADILARQDIVITTAAIPGKPSPVLITSEMVNKMKPGTVIVDLAAERGGNCQLTQYGQTVCHQGVVIMGPENVPATVPNHASQLFGKNIENLLKHLVDSSGQLVLDFDDQIVSDTLIAHRGEVVHPHLQELLKVVELKTGT